MQRTCQWCCKIVDTKISRPTIVFCNVGCRDANTLFEEMFSDEEINRKAHYWSLTHPQTPEEGGA